MVQLSTVKAQAPELASTFMQAGKLLTSKGMRQGTHKATVMVALDHSGSTEDGRNRLYSGPDRVMQSVSNLAFTGGLFFDDDGKVPGALFDTRVHELGDIHLGNFRDFLNNHRDYGFGGTSYVAVLKWIIKTAGFGDVDLGYPGQPLAPKATAQYPVYAVIVTDGEPLHDREEDIINLLTLMSQLPIFVQFIGVGYHEFKFLKKLDKLGGRLIDNAGFFDAKTVPNQEAFLAAMLSEFAGSFYKEAQRVQLVTG